MKIEDQVVSLELAKKLKELGVKQESLFSYVAYGKEFKGDEKPSFSNGFKSDEFTWCSAFTVAELGQMLPVVLPKKTTETVALQLIKYKEDRWRVCYTGDNNYAHHDVEAKSETDARAKMLIYLLENKLIPLQPEKGTNVK